MEVEISLERILNLKFGLSLDWSFEQLTHIDKFSGHESGTTSPWTIIGMSHVASIGGGLMHLGMIEKSG